MATATATTNNVANGNGTNSANGNSTAREVSVPIPLVPAVNGALTGTKPSGMQAYAAPSLFQPHNARQAVRDAHDRKIPPMLGVYYGFSTVHHARLLAPIGFDCAWVDWEHTSCNVETMTTMVHEVAFMSSGKTIPWVRVPGHDHAAIGFALDCGASIVVPQVDTVEQCKHVISAAKYGTRQNGTRSAPPFRLMPGVTAMPMFGTDMHKSLNNQAAIMIQIETLEGINNLDAILTECPDVDCVWLGGLDARLSMNLPAPDFTEPSAEPSTEPEWLAAVDTYWKAMKKHNKPHAGFACGIDGVKDAADGGFSIIFYDADVMRFLPMVSDLAEARRLVSVDDKAKA